LLIGNIPAEKEDTHMVICPIALAVHCNKCPIVKFCPAKTIIGDYGTTDGDSAKGDADQEKTKPKDKPGDS
jgi:hypothetical protein